MKFTHLLGMIFLTMWMQPVLSREVITDDWMYQIVSALNERDPIPFNQAFDKNKFMERVFKDLSADSSQMKDFRKGMETGLNQAAETLIASFTEETRLKLIRIQQAEEIRILVRVNMGEEGLSFLEFIVEKDVTGKNQIVDWYNYAFGQNYSESLRQFIPLVFPENNTVLARFLNLPSLSKEDLKKLVELFSLFAKQDYEMGLLVYRTLPEVLQNNRLLLLIRIKMASSLGDEKEYQDTLATIATHHGKDPKLCLMLIDHYYFEEKYGEALAALERLDQYTGGDATIDNLRASVYILMNKMDLAIQSAKKAIASDPELEDAYWMLLETQVQAGKFEDAVETLYLIEDKLKYFIHPEDLKRLQGYGVFGQSEAFATWSQEIRSRSKEDNRKES